MLPLPLQAPPCLDSWRTKQRAYYASWSLVSEFLLLYSHCWMRIPCFLPVNGMSYASPAAWHTRMHIAIQLRVKKTF